MEPIEKRMEEAQSLIVPILNRLNLDISAQPYVDAAGAVRAKPVYIEQAPKVAAVPSNIMDSEPPTPAEPEQPKSIDQAIQEELKTSE